MSPSIRKLIGRHEGPQIPRFFAAALAAILTVRAGTAIAQTQTPPAEEAQRAPVYPIFADGFSQSLDGRWSFKFIPSLDAGKDATFYDPATDVSGWRTIPVPANWEIQGFAEPHYYMDLQDGLGLYRRTFRVPAAWRGGRRVILRFEGVTFGFQAWVNGKNVGASVGSGFNPTSLDITDALSSDPDRDNTLAVEVTTKPPGWQSDVWDDWDLSGIFRDVTLFSVPTTHLEDLTTRTKVLGADAAELSVSARVNQPGGELRGKLIAPGGETVGDFTLDRKADGQFHATVHVTQAQLWTAETPALYHLQLSLSAKGQVLQTLDERIGLREISIADGVLKLNGRPIKLHGVDRHDEAPDVGRALTEAHWKRDLDMMQQGNINFVRTSHAPPNSRFLDLCDQYGIYVLCEVPLAHFQKNLKNSPAYMCRVEQTVNRDKNHASVIAWSIGNENGISDGLLEAGRRAKALDPTRPICYPMVGTSFDATPDVFPDFVDMFALHYPTNAMLLKWTQTLNRPVILTEYAHANGLAGDHIQTQWDMMQAAPHFAGGAIWHLMDQGLLRQSDKPVDRNKPTSGVWIDATHYYDMHGTAGQDGILYADRTPQSDFWEARKVYAPVQLAAESAIVNPGPQAVSITVSNRYDFRSLQGLRLLWSLNRNCNPVVNGENALKASPHEGEKIRIPVSIPADSAGDLLSLNLRCIDEKGLQINELAIPLERAGSKIEAWLGALPSLGQPRVTESPEEITIACPQWVFTVSRKTGQARIADRSGQVLLDGIYPHAGRALTEPERGRLKRLDMWPSSTLSPAEAPQITVNHEDRSIHLEVAGRYLRPDKREQSFIGRYQAEISPAGTIAIRYDYSPNNGTGSLAEAGLSLELPATMTEFRWIGMGPYAGYPGKDRLNDFGVFHLNANDLRFQGNRRQTDIALLTNAAGAGVALVANRGDIAVERAGDHLLLSSNALISGLGEKGRTPETLVDLSKPTKISGSLTILPLSNGWPEPLVRLFGKPEAACEVFKPFYHSYDQ